MNKKCRTFYSNDRYHIPCIMRSPLNLNLIEKLVTIINKFLKGALRVMKRRLVNQTILKLSLIEACTDDLNLIVHRLTDFCIYLGNSILHIFLPFSFAISDEYYISLLQLVELLDSPLHKYFEQHDCLNYFFCFRWVLIQFKRSYSLYHCHRSIINSHYDLCE